MKNTKPKTKFSDEAVKAKTGKVWKEWFALLNKAGAKQWKHSEIATCLYKNQGVPRWWCQMMAVEYEKAHGLREKFQTSTGDFAANAVRTFTAPVAKIYRVWTDDKQRRKWLGAAKVEITTATKNKSVRAAWSGNKSRLSVNFYPKEPKKIALAVDHMKLGSAKEVAEMKAYWFSALNRLGKYIS